MTHWMGILAYNCRLFWFFFESAAVIDGIHHEREKYIQFRFGLFPLVLVDQIQVLPNVFSYLIHQNVALRSYALFLTYFLDLLGLTQVFGEQLLSSGCIGNFQLFQATKLLHEQDLSGKTAPEGFELLLPDPLSLLLFLLDPDDVFEAHSIGSRVSLLQFREPSLSLYHFMGDDQFHDLRDFL